MRARAGFSGSRCFPPCLIVYRQPRPIQRSGTCHWLVIGGHPEERTGDPRVCLMLGVWMLSMSVVRGQWCKNGRGRPASALLPAWATPTYPSGNRGVVLLPYVQREELGLPDRQLARGAVAAARESRQARPDRRSRSRHPARCPAIHAGMKTGYLLASYTHTRVVRRRPRPRHLSRICAGGVRRQSVEPNVAVISPAAVPCFTALVNDPGCPRGGWRCCRDGVGHGVKAIVAARVVIVKPCSTPQFAAQFAPAAAGRTGMCRPRERQELRW